MGLTLNEVLDVGGEAIEVAVAAEEVITLDAAQIKAGMPATSPGVGGTVEGVAGKFTVTFTPNAVAKTA